MAGQWPWAQSSLHLRGPASVAQASVAQSHQPFCRRRTSLIHQKSRFFIIGIGTRRLRHQMHLFALITMVCSDLAYCHASSLYCKSKSGAPWRAATGCQLRTPRAGVWPGAVSSGSRPMNAGPRFDLPLPPHATAQYMLASVCRCSPTVACINLGYRPEVIAVSRVFPPPPEANVSIWLTPSFPPLCLRNTWMFPYKTQFWYPSDLRLWRTDCVIYVKIY